MDHVNAGMIYERQIGKGVIYLFGNLTVFFEENCRSGRLASARTEESKIRTSREEARKRGRRDQGVLNLVSRWASTRRRGSVGVELTGVAEDGAGRGRGSRGVGGESVEDVLHVVRKAGRGVGHDGIDDTVSGEQNIDGCCSKGGGGRDGATDTRRPRRGPAW